MAKKMLGKAKMVRHLTQYQGEFWLYELSKMVKVGKESYRFVIAGVPKVANGHPGVSVFSSTEDGELLLPIYQHKTHTVVEALLALGYE